jgi:EmrB/QacA subfamily drug resistance transporter
MTLLERRGRTLTTEGMDHKRYRWVAMAVILLGTFMVILDTSIVNVALPQIGADFHSVAAVDWIVTSYLLAVGVSIMATGWLADHFGKKRVFVVSLSAFTLGSILCALAPSLPFLVVARVIQGLGGGALMPLGMAMIYELFAPEDRGMALGIWGVAAMAAPAVGPVLGGFLVTTVSWRLLFVINVPIGFVGVPAAALLLRDLGARDARRLDVTGLLFSAVGLVLVLLALSEAPTWGWGSTTFIVTMVVGVALLGVWIVRSLHISGPLIELRMFRIPAFSLTMVIVWLITISQFARLVFIPLEFETLRGVSALSVGLMLTPSALGVAMTMPIGGRLADRIGARIPVSIGLAITASSFWPLGHLQIDTPMWVVSIWLFVGGLGVGLAMMPNTVIAMNSVHGRFVAQASAVRSLNRQVAASLGTAVLASFLASRIGPIGSHAGKPTVSALAGYNDVFLIALAFALGALTCAFWLPGKEAARALQEERRAEGPVAGFLAEFE